MKQTRNTSNMIDEQDSNTSQLAAAGCSHYEMARAFHEQSFEYSDRPDRTSEYPRLSLEDLQLRQVLGCGAFGIVSAVRVLDAAAKLENTQKRAKQASNFSSASTQILDSADDEELLLEDSAEERVATFALKQLQQFSLEPEDLGRAIADLVTEARLLAEINHPHIVRLRAISNGPKFDRSFFIVIDRFRCTLVKRVEEWKLAETQLSGFLSGRLSFQSKPKRAALFQERLCAARDLGSALQYLHENRIVFRDLKEENVAFDAEGQIQLFDFGLAKELPALSHKDQLYNMTPHTGTLRYMAPEVAKGQPYNESCDVYSFAILLWEILSLKRAFSSFTNQLLEEMVVRPPCRRPTRHSKWPQELREMMHKAWSPRISDRPTAKDVELVLMDLCLDDNLPTNKRHSITLMQKKHHSFRSHSFRNHLVHHHKPCSFHLFHHKHSGDLHSHSHHSHHAHHHLHGDADGDNDDDCCSSTSSHAKPWSTISVQ